MDKSAMYTVLIAAAATVAIRYIIANYPTVGTYF